ncbi:hypothetical protein, conserved [Eimeria tenella]|uniref:JmjC domain-containing protein n=1 Tax=Eimeria tenella TaxID=5802 RepID=U6KYC0_EIMTE|nr:hypothetical protein, conserved [Eimeria tenella]CDJ40480.1 hypothetical protein, conserved [Eimeria tenella]|eukprot:XP_013231230.1 hypothetical protein, conserved [Eimeria tenella]
MAYFTSRNLVPSQFNIWMGHSCVGSSTGLHHDFHDNFYCLVRGRKEFRLYSPRLCELLRTQGMAKPLSAPSVHPNGLISYIRGIREDGAHELSVLRTRQLTLERTTNALREQLAGCEKRLQAASEGKNTTELKMEAKKLKDMLDHAESELDHCLEAALDAAAYESGVDDDDSTSNDSELMEGRLVQEGAYPDHFCLTGTEQPCTTSWDGPLNAANVLKRFWSVWVEEGDILYLPASWFHEVISYSSGTQKDSEKLSGTPADTKDSVHLAFNIWMHPPCLDGTFEKPYIDGYWAQHAAQQVEKQKAASVSALVYNQKYLRAFPLQRHTAQQDERSHQQDSSGGAHGSRLACHIPYSADDAEAVISPPKCVRINVDLGMTICGFDVEPSSLRSLAAKVPFTEMVEGAFGLCRRFEE